MSLSEDVAQLRRVKLFAGVEASKLKPLALASERVTFRRGETLFEEDEIGHLAYVIIEGEVEVVVRTADGPRTIATLGRNEFVGEIAALYNVPRTATVRARSDLTARRVSKDLLVGLMMESPRMAAEIMRVVSQRLEQLDRVLGRAEHDPAASGDDASAPPLER